MKVTVISCPEYEVHVEPCDFGHVAHVDVLVPWTKDIKRRLQADCLAFRRIYRRPVFAVHYPEQGPTHEKFLSMFGFHPLGPATDHTGRACWMWLAPAPLDQSKGDPNG